MKWFSKSNDIAKLDVAKISKTKVIIVEINKAKMIAARISKALAYKKL